MKIGSVQLRPIHIAIIVLTLITAVIHLSLGGAMFTLNGLGYLGLLAAYFLPFSLFLRFHRQIRWAFAAYIIVTIVGYFVFNSGGAWLENTLGLVTKAVEVVLLILLFVDARSA